MMKGMLVGGCFSLIFFMLVSPHMDSIHAQPESKPGDEEYLTLSDLFRLCHDSGRCGERLCCEDKEVRVKGYLDYVNIFHSKTYPNVTRPKFRIFDGPGIATAQNPWTAYQDAIEIYPVKGDVERLSDRLIESRGMPLRMVYVEGTIRGVDAPTERGVLRLIEIAACADKIIVIDDAKGKPRP
jgi:hypothetical protein